MDSYKNKYLKYKIKYMALTESNTFKSNQFNMTGGGNDKIEVMLFKAEWCGHCIKFKPVWEQLKNEYNNKFQFTMYDGDENKDKIKEYNIKGFPSIVFKDGSTVQPYNGPHDIETLQAIFGNFVKL